MIRRIGLIALTSLVAACNNFSPINSKEEAVKQYHHIGTMSEEGFGHCNGVYKTEILYAAKLLCADWERDGGYCLYPILDGSKANEDCSEFNMKIYADGCDGQQYGEVKFVKKYVPGCGKEREYCDGVIRPKCRTQGCESEEEKYCDEINKICMSQLYTYGFYFAPENKDYWMNVKYPED